MRAPRGIVAVALAVLAASLAACDAAGPDEVRITIRHSAFDLSTIDVEPGRVVRFVIENTDPIDHEFILGDDDVQERHENGTEPSHGAVPGEVSIPAGETAVTTFRFGPDPGTLVFACHLPGHLAYGMRGEVRIG